MTVSDQRPTKYTDEVRAQMKAREEAAKARWAEEVRIRKEEEEARRAAEEKAKAEEEAARRRERDAKAAVRKAHRDELKRRRDTAKESDRRLGAAIDTLERIRASALDRKRNAERRAAEAAEIRLTIRRMEQELAVQRDKLARLEKATSSVVDYGEEDAEVAVQVAWEIHNSAWSGFSRSYVKLHRDRSVRKRMRMLNLNA